MKAINPIRGCPFCGGKAKESFDGGLRYVRCTECGAQGQKFHVREVKGDNIDAYNLAINKWNTRANTSPKDLPFMDGYKDSQNDLSYDNGSEEDFEEVMFIDGESE
jgi:transcription elongation factor Elf1